MNRASVHRKIWGVLLLLCAIHCGGESADSSPNTGDSYSSTLEENLCLDGGTECLGSGPNGEDQDSIFEGSLESCPGYKANDNFPASYVEFCENAVSPELLATGDTCFLVLEPENAGCFCKICALKGAVIQCVSEQCK